VTVFFVLSGFLITTKLIQEPIDLKRFYIRRLFRLMPVAWTYLAVIILIGHLTRAPLAPPSALLACLFFYRNFNLVAGGAATWHFWSLSLEEQYYLAWPCILLLAGTRKSRWVAVAGALGCAIFRYFFWSHYDRAFFNCQSQVRADALFVGSLMALLWQESALRALALRTSRIWALPSIAILLYCIARFTLLPPLIECVCIAALMAASMLHPQSIFVWPLTSRALSQLGIVSYSIYVWQELFMLITPANSRTGAIVPLFAMLLCALGSYVYIERPFTRLGQRLTCKQERTA
jgi:peptidoglycan/LPS O-acetylase OafA/YrhL